MDQDVNAGNKMDARLLPAGMTPKGGIPANPAWFRLGHRSFSIFLFDICLFIERQFETAVHDTKDGNILI
jgi:hypothetical protein